MSSFKGANWGLEVSMRGCTRRGPFGVGRFLPRGLKRGRARLGPKVPRKRERARRAPGCYFRRLWRWRWGRLPVTVTATAPSRVLGPGRPSRHRASAAADGARSPRARTLAPTRRAISPGQARPGADAGSHPEARWKMSLLLKQAWRLPGGPREHMVRSRAINLT